jgi:N-terminal domain of toast_rack, DUF2154
MSMKTAIRLLSLPAMLLAISAGPACNVHNMPAGPMQTDTQSVKLGDAKSVHVAIKMGAGDLKVESGAAELLDAEFTYNHGRRPRVDYNVVGSEGQLSVEEPSGEHLGGHGRYDWDLRLNSKVPMEMNVEQGAGDAHLNLGGLSLSRLDVKTGVGDTTVDLAGEWKNDLWVHVKGGIGDTTIRLPLDVGVKVQAHGGIGSISGGDLKKEGDFYENDSYGKSPVTIHVEVEHGIGDIKLQLTSTPPVV